MIESVPHSLRRQLLADIGDAFGVTSMAILSPSRAPLTVQARWVYMLALRDAGYCCLQIGAACNRDRSTVLHGLRRAGADAALVALARDLREGRIPTERVPQLSSFPPALCGPVLAYVRALVGQAGWGPMAYQGVHLLACDPALRRAADQLLADRGWGQHSWRIRVHCKQLYPPCG
jgi:hypothetical protein